MPHTRPELAPGLMVVHGNHPEALRDVLVAWLAAHPLAPLEDEHVLVQSNGIAQWLRLALARDVADGGCGIAAALQMQLPQRFIWQAYRAVLGEDAVPAESPFDKPLLVWRLMRLLPALLHEDVFAPLRRFLEGDADCRKRHQLAERLADLFDQYQVYRADWLQAWADGDDVLRTSRQGDVPVPDTLRWQPRLWRALLQDVGPHAHASRAQVHQRFMAAALAGDAAARPAGLPRRLVVFGISSLPQQALEVLAALARWTQVLMCVHNPCEHDWSHIVADRDLLRADRLRQRRRAGGEGEIPDHALHQHAQPLLAAWGKQGRDFIRLLDSHDEREAYAQRLTAIGQRVDCFDPNAADTLLRQLQDDIRDLRPLAETQATWPGVDAARDPSIRFHVAHGPQREVEVLHDQLLAAFAADPTLRPRDVIVMVPDVATYAAHVQAVFGLHRAQDARHIPFAIADQGQRHHDPLLGAVERLLGLPASRLSVSDVLDSLEVPALRARFRIEEAQLPLLQRWIAAANVRWGLHARQRASLGLPDGQSHNSWDFGLQRMLLGYAVGSGQAWADIEPMDEIGGLDAALLGPLADLLAALQRHWEQLSARATPAQWGVRLAALLDDFFQAPEGADGFTLLRLRQSLQDWVAACEAAGFDEALPLSVVREHWLAQAEPGGLQQPFFAGAVTFATLMPMRAIPFRVVALLGMNDGDYPRSRTPLDFDLMAQDWRPGDRSRREDDRYLFLEALLSARDHLHVSWVGRSIHDHSERPPSVLVAQLRDHLAAGWHLAGDEALPAHEAGARLLEALTIEHRLQPFHPDYFSAGGDARLFSHASEWLDGLRAAGGPAQGGGEALAPTAWAGPLTLRTLSDFLRNPAQSFFRLRLGIHFQQGDEAADDAEPFAVGGLQNWRLQDELIQAQQAVFDDIDAAGDGARVAALEHALARIARRGELPAGAFGALAQAGLSEPMERLFSDYAQALAEWPMALADEPLDHLPEGLDASLRLADWLTGLRARAGDGGAGARMRLVLDSGSLIAQKPRTSYRLDRIVPFWIAHVAGHLDGQPFTTLVFNKTGPVQLHPLAREAARDYWRRLLDAFVQGLARPLPLAVRAGAAWLGARNAGQNAATAAEAARAAFEDHDPARGRWGERESSADLARAFVDFASLAEGGEFEHWVQTLIAPLDAAIVRATARDDA
ncbi:MAG: exodeoxyribonuclease V subunit gamma [Burkholderiales bacterium]|nr:exodeoxyribonuclease V subunit gamma [Burkholderiales bacterium]